MDRRPVVLYDADCDLCVWTMAGLLRWDRRREVRPLPLQAPEADALLGTMEVERKMSSWHIVSSDGQIHSAGRGLEAVLRLLPGGRAFASLARRFPRGADRLYDTLAGRRSLLGLLIPGRWRRRARERVERRQRQRG